MRRRYFVERLEADGMPLAGLVVNRIGRVSAHRGRPAGGRALAAAESLEDGGGPSRRPNAAGLLATARALS